MGAFFNGALKPKAYDPTATVQPSPGVGDRIINQIVANLTGVNLIGNAKRKALGDAQRGFMNDFQSALGPQYQDGAAPEIKAPSIGDSAPAAPQGGLDQLPDAPQAPAAASSSTPYTYTAPQRTSDGLNIASPQLPALIFQAQRLGVPVDKVLDVLKANQAHMVRGDNGVFYDEHDASLKNRIAPKVDPGQFADYAPDGTFQGVKTDQGYLRGLGQSEAVKTAAQEGAKAAFVYGNAENQARGSAVGSSPYEFINVPGPNGQPITIAKSRAAGGVFEGQTPDTGTYRADTAKAASTQYANLQTAGQNAPGKIATLKQIDSLLEGWQGGKLAPAGLEIASVASSLPGMGLSPKMSNAQAADALAKGMALQLRDPSSGGGMPGSMSNSDRDYLNKMVPGLQQSAQGRRQLVQIGIATEQRKADVAAKARQWQDRFGRIDAPDSSGKHFQDYLGSWAAQHPLFGTQ